MQEDGTEKDETVNEASNLLKFMDPKAQLSIAFYTLLYLLISCKPRIKNQRI